MLKKTEFYRKRAILFFSIFLVIGTFMVGGSLYMRDQNLDQRAKANTPEEETNEQLETITKTDILAPEIINIPPQTVYVDEEYSYPIKLYDADTENTDLLSIYLIQGPDWLKLLNKRLYGTPPTDKPETYKIILKLSDGKNEREETFYISTKKRNKN